ncbi:LETM1-domain-containing protein [Ascobolus immersus RN42]|uniref:LETM1-domain-containing protein n=1 Tax=Ascobolus immersus RN42 TaxID=1160509 RepID=A0A3N4IVF9_ASCIM|nr:LETM1-domain-containing protein [Ascobolus immersus RN42]
MNSARLVSSAQRSFVATSVARSALRTRSVNRVAQRHCGLGSTIGLHNVRNLPSEIPLMVLLSRRNISTEHNTTSAPPNAPPPGFKIEDAKKPLPADHAKTSPEVPSSADTLPATPLATTTIVGQEDKVLATTKEATELAEKKKEAERKKTLWEKVKHELQHYWDGTKLLGAEIKISTRLALKMAAGYELSRREHRQLKRTLQDLGRLVPFSVFIIVPAGELFLPIVLKFFPNMLPSTYEDAGVKEKRTTKLRTTRKEVSDFLKTTLHETGLPVNINTRQTEEFSTFFRKIRQSDERPTREEIIKICKIFKDDLTLDNLSRPQLVAMCRYMNLSAFGTDSFLRYNVRHRMRQIKRDDRAISYEGIDSLTVTELQMACASRGIRTHGVSVGRLRDDLQTWLDLRLKHGVPSTLLVLSNAFMYAQGKEGELDSYYDALVAVMSSIPDELVHEIQLEAATTEGVATNKQRLEVLREQQELIDEEAAQSKEGGKTVGSKTDRDIDDEHHRAQNVEAEAKVNEQSAQADAKAAEAAADAPKSEEKK